jgi:hypothetical protein
MAPAQCQVAQKAEEARVKGRLRLAQALYRRYLRLRPDDPISWYMLGQVYRDRHRPTLAEPCYHHALTLAPDYWRVHAALGRFLRSTGRAREAHAAFTRAVALGANEQTRRALLDLSAPGLRPDADAALLMLHRMSRYIPHFIALSASSPYVQGQDTAFDSARLNSVFAFPLSGRAPMALTWDDFTTYFNKMTRTGVVKSMKDFYWDIRPKPEFGTIEIRVFDTPLAESGIIGLSIGLAMGGLHPVPEIQFEGFLGPAYDQICSHAARMRSRTRGAFTVPMTIRIPVGGGIHAPELHSDSPEAISSNAARDSDSVSVPPLSSLRRNGVSSPGREGFANSAGPSCDIPLA